MTRAALLQLLDSPASLSAAAVQDLEQLAQAFPYCQTAHLLLAKAAHDQGSMLADQRLRRAATYAADRQLLRQLLELPTPQPAVAGPASGFTATTALTNQPPSPAAIEVSAAEGAASSLLGVPVGLEGGVGNEQMASVTAAPAAEETQAQPLTTAIVGPAETADAQAAPTSAEAALVSDVGGAAGPVVDAAEEETDGQLATVPLSIEETPPEAMPEPVEVAPEPATATDGIPVEAAKMETATTKESVIEEPAIAEEAVAAAEPTGQGVAAPLPLIRPPAEVGTARFEFGLSAPALAAEFTAYQLPEVLNEELAASAARLPGSTAGPAAFRGVEELAYALGSGSRLGYAMQPAFRADADITGADAGQAATVNPPGSILPSAGEFFAPDALLLEHLASQPPPVPPVPSSLELIDSFLRRAPQRRRGIVTLLTVPEQADLSMRSTRAESDLASESLARILAGQGKTERAIAVYELLMGRQPEKSAYFAVQIDLLRNPPTPSS